MNNYQLSIINKKKGAHCFNVARNFRVVLFSLFIVHCSLFIVNCDLSDPLAKQELQEKMEENVRWANAARLSVTVAIPLDWGASPQIGTDKCFDNARTDETPRQGYPFTVEFTPLSGFGLEKWLAFKTADYAGLDTSKTAFELASVALNDNGVTIIESVSQTGAKTAVVTINISDPVTLVPWCSDRPAVIQSNPPLINTGTTYGRGQEIRIWFSLDIDVDTIGFGAGKIELSARKTLSDGSTEIYENVQRHFKDPVYQNRRISITPKEEDRPPANLIITVSVGTKIAGANGNTLAAPAEFFYRTDDRVIRNVYYAENIWAVHKPDDAEDGADFFYQGAANDRDRRLRKTNGEYKVTLYFTVSPSSADIEPTPNAYDIVFIEYSNLAGDDPNNVVAPNMKKTVTSIAAATDPAAAIYRSASQAGAATVYRADYTLNQGYIKPGIIRLAVLPYRTGAVEPDNWENAVAEMRFVTVALDNEPPGVIENRTADFTLSGQVPGSAGNYNDSSNKMLAITPNFTWIADNKGKGIRRMSATLNRPWTMDEQSVLEWRYSIEKLAVDTERTADYESAWFAFGENPPDLDLTGIQFKSANSARKVKAQFTDSLGNESGWFEMAAITYYTPDAAPVTVYGATYYDETYEEAAQRNTIVVKWTQPASMNRVEIQINDGAKETKETYTATNGSHTIASVPRIDAAGVRSGRAVGNVTGYTITLTAYNDYVRVAPATFKIWNIPGMSVSETYPVYEVIDQSSALDPVNKTVGLANIAVGNANVKYALANDITLTAWTPKGTDSVTNAFEGKFYGNGHTITINSFNPAYTGAQYGLFSFLRNAAVRDLCVEYAVTVSKTGALTLGGIGGYCNESSKIHNVIVGGDITFTVNGSGDVYAGGIAGYLTRTAAPVNDDDYNVQNSVSQANVTIINNSTGALTFGGLFGYVTNSTVKECESYGGIIEISRGTSTSAGQYIIGGFAGSFLTGKLVNCGSKIEKIRVYKNAEISVGGFAGYVRANLETCFSYTHIEVNIESSVRVNAGGFIGRISDATNSNVTIQRNYASGSVTVNKDGGSNTYAGGFMGYVQSGPGGSVSTRDCYALGNVSVNQTSGSIYAVGFIAWGEDSSVRITRCFTTGSILVQSSGGANVTAGGLFGWTYNGDGGNVPRVDTVSNSAVLGESITVKTSGAKYLGRVYGYCNTAAVNLPFAGINNYAVDTLKIYQQTDNGPFEEAPIEDVRSVTSAPFTLTVSAAGGKTVSVGAPNDRLTPGTAGTVEFPVTTTGISTGTYTATVANRPSGVTVSGSVAINNNSGTLTLAGNTSTVQGISDTLTLTLDGATSAPFTLIVSADEKNVVVGKQRATFRTGSYGSQYVEYPVITTGISGNFTFTGGLARVDNLPSGFSGDGSVTISGNSGTLTLRNSGNSPILTKTDLTLRIDNTTSGPFTVIVGDVSVNTQSGTLTAGTAGTVTISVATSNIGGYFNTAKVDNLPAGVRVTGFSNGNGSGTLTLAGDTSTVQGTTGNLTLRSFNHFYNSNGEIRNRVLFTPGFWRDLFSDASHNANDVWNLYTPVAKNGYPTLKGVGGQE